MLSFKCCVVLLAPILCKDTSGEIITDQPVELRWDFSNCGKVGRFGPTQELCDEAYQGTNLDGDVSVESGIQEWAVPTAGLYLITARSPPGSMDKNRNSGRGAHLTGEFKLETGDILQILVGQYGILSDEGRYDRPLGGSGGTFVVKRATEGRGGQILMIAGGASCGSGANWNRHNSISDASLFPYGNNASIVQAQYGIGGINGDGGNAGYILNGADSAAGGGAGYSNDGARASVKRGSFSEVGTPRPARSFLSKGFTDMGPAVGGHFEYVDEDLTIENNGGFGGGGSGSGNGGCGGGGGYSGGAGGSISGWGGGGGSINNGLKRRNDLSNVGPGAVTISFIGQQCCGPMPAYIAMTFVAGIVVASVIACTVKRVVNSMKSSDGSIETKCGLCWTKLWKLDSIDDPTIS